MKPFSLSSVLPYKYRLMGGVSVLAIYTLVPCHIYALANEARVDCGYASLSELGRLETPTTNDLYHWAYVASRSWIIMRPYTSLPTVRQKAPG